MYASEVRELDQSVESVTVHACRLALCFLTAGEQEHELWDSLIHHEHPVQMVITTLNNALG